MNPIRFPLLNVPHYTIDEDYVCTKHLLSASLKVKNVSTKYEHAMQSSLSNISIQYVIILYSLRPSNYKRNTAAWGRKTICARHES